jgi:3-hydroxyacyl-[acyl-carrier-protein] dehydratase
MYEARAERPMADRYDGESMHGLLPHRYPFLFVDTLEVLEHGRRARGLKRVTGEECLFDPNTGAPLGWPNLLVLEALAQATAAVLVGATDGAAGAIGYFANMEQVRLRDPALPGDTIVLDVELLRMRRSIAWVKGAARVDGRLVARALFTVALRARAEGGMV